MNTDAIDYKEILKHLPASYLLLDADSVVIEASDVYFQLLQITAANVIGNKLAEIYSKQVQTDDLKKILHSLNYVNQSGQMHELEIKAQLPIKTINPRHAQRYLKITHTPVLSGKYIIHHVTNITDYVLIKNIESQEHKLTEDLLTQAGQMEGEIHQQLKELEKRNQELQVANAALAKSETAKARLAAIVEFATDAVVTISLSGKIETWNNGAEKLYGYREGEILGKSVDLLYPDAMLQKFTEIIQAMQKGRVIHFAETECKHKNGHHIPVSITMSPIRNNQGEVTGYCGIARDLSELKKNQILIEKNKELEEMSKLKSQFVANVSHELRTPLHCILGFSQMLLHDQITPLADKQKEYVADILSSGKYLNTVINDILDLTKIEAGKMELYPVYIDIFAIVEETKVAFKNSLQEKGLKFTTRVDEGIGEIFIDPERLKQIIYNFVSNAIKFTPAGGKISLQIQPNQNNTFRLTVTDTGIGINQENLGKLFVEFQQLDSSTTKKYQGSGLGLALVQKLATLLGGKVGVKSKINKGSSFYVILPVR